MSPTHTYSSRRNMTAHYAGMKLPECVLLHSWLRFDSLWFVLWWLMSCCTCESEDNADDTVTFSFIFDVALTNAAYVTLCTKLQWRISATCESLDRKSHGWSSICSFCVAVCVRPRRVPFASFKLCFPLKTFDLCLYIYIHSLMSEALCCNNLVMCCFFYFTTCLFKKGELKWQV